MFQKRLIWQLYPSYLLITILSLAAVTWYSSSAMRSLYLETLKEYLVIRARVIEERIQRDQIPMTVDSIDPICKSMGEVLDCRITVVLPTGQVIGESDEDPTKMENHRERPEIKEAFQDRIGNETRYSHTVQQNMIYIAVPYKGEHGEVDAVIRVSLSAHAINNTLGGVYLHILWGGLVVLLIAAAICFWVSHQISRPLQQLKEGADRFARGDLKMRLIVPESEEIAHVAEAMNEMAEQLDNRIRTITRQRKQQEAIFASMVEGVLAVDMEKRLISMNQAAAKLLNVADYQKEGKHISEIIDDPDIYQLIDQSLASEGTMEAEIVLGEKEKQFLQAHGAALFDFEGCHIGSVIVLHNITTLRRLENMRRDFVANVSHELKTPITSIKGFVETLMDGALNDSEDAMRFLEIIARQADRLHAIIEDLLSLSRIEQDESKGSIPLEPFSTRALLNNVVECCKLPASDKKITLEIFCEEDIFIQINPPLLEQALVNLVDNAIKYSEEGSAVRLKAVRVPNRLAIHVQDWGCGIEEEYLSRIFERFYRVDKARSRKLGGTGLGLAIVKHIVHAHGGQVTVSSEMGVGSVFTILLPLEARTS